MAASGAKVADSGDGAMIEILGDPSSPEKACLHMPEHIQLTEQLHGPRTLSEHFVWFALQPWGSDRGTVFHARRLIASLDATYVENLTPVSSPGAEMLKLRTESEND